MLNAMGAGIRLCGTVRVRMDQMDEPGLIQTKGPRAQWAGCWCRGTSEGARDGAAETVLSRARGHTVGASLRKRNQ